MTSKMALRVQGSAVPGSRILLCSCTKVKYCMYSSTRSPEVHYVRNTTHQQTCLVGLLSVAIHSTAACDTEAATVSTHSSSMHLYLT